MKVVEISGKLPTTKAMRIKLSAWEARAPERAKYASSTVSGRHGSGLEGQKPRVDAQAQNPSVESDPGDVERRAARGGVITAIAQAVRGVSEAAGTLLLARMLSPADFGLVDMIVSITGIIDMLKDFGLSTATIQRDRIQHREVSALFWINVAMGLVLTLVTAAAAPFIAITYKRPELLQLTLALSLSTLLGALAVQHIALLRRELKFERLGVIDVACSVMATVTGVLAAVRGFGPWALVIRQLCRLGLQALLSFLLCSFRPDRPRRTNVRELLRFGTHLSGFQVVNYMERNLDNVLIGRFAGAEALGFYSKAYDLMRLPLNQVNGPVGSVAIPALSRLMNHPERYRNAYRAVVTLLMLITVPLAPLMILSADWLIPTVMGPQWTGAVRVFQVLALTLFTKPLANATGWLFVTQARTQELWHWGLLGGVIAIVSFIVGLPWGALGVAVAYGASDTFIRMPILLSWAGKTGPVSRRDLLACLVPAWICAATVGLVYGLAAPRFHLSPGLTFLVFAPLSLAAGFAVLVVTPWGRHTLRDGMKMLRALKRKDEAA
jgi:PST family polysaccharide transporter